MQTTLMDIQDAQIHFFDLITLVAGGTEVILVKNKIPLIRLMPVTGQAVRLENSTSTAEVAAEFEEHNTWLSLSQTGLSAAYGDNEPEYSLNLIKERNPTYAGE